MDLDIKIIDQFVSEEGSVEERGSWLRIKAALRNAPKNTALNSEYKQCQSCKYQLCKTCKNGSNFYIN